MEQTEKNFKIFITKLEEIGVPTKVLVEKYGDAIKSATFSHRSEYGLAYDGALLQVILYKLTPYAIKMNELYPESMRVNRNQLIKVCLLHQLSKSVRLTKNINEWQVKNGGQPYMFNPNQPSIRTGLHSLAMCQECGINFTLEEVEAMTTNDRDATDMQAKWHSSIFASIVNNASEMVYLEAMQNSKSLQNSSVEEK